jgi:hypothetical protein
MDLSLVLDKALRGEDKEKQVSDAVIRRCRDRAKTMLAALAPKQRAMVLDPSPHVSALCPRRAGKTFAAALAALITGELKPGAISLIISLNLKQLRRLYWSGSASGLYTLAKKFKLDLEFNGTYLRWEHQNGSVGYLLGCEDEEQMEVMRGMEADLYIIDECKSFAPGRLAKLIDDILDPQRASRDGRIIMIGTPGFLPAGPFYQATHPTCVDKTGRPYLIPAGEKDQWGRDAVNDLLWSFHTWHTKDNPAKACQNTWRDFQIKKKARGWSDDHPTWLREAMGQWTAVNDGLVFRYAKAKSANLCVWTPEPTKDNPTGLPEEGAPWRFIAGLDLGYEAPTALVVAAYSRKLGQLRVVHEAGRRHMLLHDIAEVIHEAQDLIAPAQIECIYADRGNLGKTLCNQLVYEYGFPIEPAEKREKYDYIEMLNAGFEAGEVFIIPGTMLEEQLLTNAWDLDDEEPRQIGNREITAKEAQAQRGKLVEDKDIPNDFSDALVYCYRGSLHRFKTPPKQEEPEYGSPEWLKKHEREMFERFCAAHAKLEAAKKAGRYFEVNVPFFVKAALGKNKWTSLPTISQRL